MIRTAKGKMAMPYDHRVIQTIPHTKVIERAGTQYLVLPHRPEESKLLTNLGYDVPAPILSNYDWAGGTPYQHQRETAALITKHRRGYILNGLGSGKTRAALFAFDYLRQIHEATRMLVAAPLSTLTPTWEAEVFAAFPHLTTSVLHGTKTQRLKALGQPADIYVINHDGLHILIDQLRDRRDIDFVLLDELTAFRNVKTRRWKAANEVSQLKKWVWGMTGSPTPLAPTDAFGQVRLITPSTGPKYFRQFRDATMYQLTQFKWLPRKDANDYVYSLMQPSVRYATEECIDLPPVTIINRDVPMSTKQARAYAHMKDQFFAQWEGGEINASNAGVRMSKLLQIAAGWVYDAEGKTLELPADDRLNEVYDVVEQAEGKVIVFAPYRHAVDAIYALMRFRYGDKTVARIYGSTSKNERDQTFYLFKNSANPKVLVAHPKAMSHGLSLVAANTIVWYSPPDSLETFEQANARIRRPGQTRHQNIICIRSAPIENVVYNRLKQREGIQNALLYMFQMQKETDNAHR